MNVFADENIPGVEDYLGDSISVTRFAGRALTPQQIADADALLVRSVTQVNEQLLAGSRVKFVGTATSGVEHIDQAYLQSAGIAFAYAPGANANSVVEYCLAAIASDNDRLEQLLAGGRVGIVGCGHVGKLFASRLHALNIQYRVYDPWLDQKALANSASLEEVLSGDVVSLHCELTREMPWPSHHLLNSAQLNLLRPDALLINASRGSVISQAALLEHLSAAPALKVVLDVWENEPHIDTSLLQKVLIASAHIAGYSADGKALATSMLCASLATHFQLPEPPGKSFLPRLPAIQLEQPATGASLVRALLQSRYDIARDDALLRGAAVNADPGAQFDLLRKHYGLRRELAGSTLDSSTLSMQDKALVTGLGCLSITDRGET